MYTDLKIVRILVAVDGSENSKRAGSYAIKLGLELRADIMTLHVVPSGNIFRKRILRREPNMITPILTRLRNNPFLPELTLK